MKEMTIDVQWRDASHTILEMEMQGEHWRWDRFAHAVELAYEHGKTVRYGVVMVFNLLKMSEVPMHALDQLVSVIDRAPSNFATIAVVTTDSGVQWFFHSRKKSVVVAADVEELLS